MLRRTKVTRTGKTLLAGLLIMLTVAGAIHPAGADTYGLSSSDPALTFTGSMTVTDPNETRGINYSGTGTVRNDGGITTTTTGGAGIASGIYSDPSANLIYNSGNITATSTADDAAAYGINTPSGASAVTNDGSITARALGAVTALSVGIYTNGALITNRGTISVSGSAPNSTIYGIINPAGVINNSGSILAAGSGCCVGLVGVSASFGTLNNSGSITATGNSSDSVYVVAADTIGGRTTNTGSISATGTGTDATVFGLQTSTGPTVNSGSITATAAGSDATFANALNSVDSEITNSGTISASASSSSVSASAYAIDASGAPITNSGTIRATATGSSGVTAYAYGVNTDSTVTNTGSITATAAGDPSDAYAIYSTGGGITNTGTIIATATSPSIATAYGIYSTGAVTNSGSITVTADGGLNNAARGIYSDSNVTNSGTISVAAGPTNAVAYGIYSGADATVNNSGTITVSAAGTPSYAYGIYFNNGGTLTNTGVIRAPDGNAYEVYVSAGTVNLQNRYNINLDGNPARASIFVGDTMNLNNALISATADPDTRFNTPYRIVEGGTVNGSFAGVSAPLNPAASLLYNSQGTPDASDDTVSLSYHPRASAVAKGADVSARLVNLTLTTVREQQVMNFLFPYLQATQLARAATAATDAPARLLKQGAVDTLYVTPYFADVKNGASTLGYTSTLAGLAAGYDRRIGDHQFGFHLGYGHATIDFDGRAFPVNTKQDQDIITFGLQGMTQWGNWTLRGDATGFYGWNDYTGATGTNFEATESAKYNSYGTVESVMAGYIVRKGRNTFFPEMGLNHTWLRQDGFSAEPTLGGWSTDYSSVSHNLVQALASLRWLNSFSLRSNPSILSVAVGGRYRMTNDDLSVRQTVPGSAPVAVTADQDRAAATATVSLIVRNGNFSTEIAYTGDYSPDVTMHGGWLKFRWAF